MKQLLYIFVLLVLASCNGGRQAENKPVLTVSIEPLRFFTEALAGDKYNVVSMVPAGSNPETYDPTPQQLVSLSQSAAYLSIGHIGFEQAWMDRIKANIPDMPVFDTSKSVELAEGHAHGDMQTDPHIWNSTRNARIIAQNIFRTLCKLDETNTSYYRERLDSLNHRIERTEQTIKALLPEADTAFLIYHPALTYFARDWGLRQICIEDEGKEPSPSHLQALIQEAREAKVRIIFIQQEFDTRNAQAIAKESGAKPVTINPLSYDWEEEMINITRALAHYNGMK